MAGADLSAACVNTDFPDRSIRSIRALSEVWGVPCFPDLASLPEPPAHALVIVPAPSVQAVLETGVAAGLKSATVYRRSLAKAAIPKSLRAASALKVLIRPPAAWMVGQNSVGFNALRERNFGLPQFRSMRDDAGLGRLRHAVRRDHAMHRQHGRPSRRATSTIWCRAVTSSVSTSPTTSISSAEDDNTRVMTTVRGRDPAAASIHGGGRKGARRWQADRGDQDRQVAEGARRAHGTTGAIAGDYGAFTAMCERYGIVVCPTLDDMIEMLLVFQAGRLPKGPRVGWVTTSGGTVDLLFDYLDEMGGIATPEFDAATKATLRPLVSHELALKNPLDAGNPVDDAHDAKLCAAIAADPNVDMLAWGGTPPSGSRVRDPAVTRSIAEQHRQAGDRIHPDGVADRIRPR